MAYVFLAHVKGKVAEMPISPLRKARERFLWPSDRSTQQLRDRIFQLQDQLASLQEEMQHLKRSQQLIHDDILHVIRLQDEARRTQLAEKGKDEVRFWAEFRRDGESDMDARQRFFRTLPKRGGDTGMLQRILAVMLTDFDRICVAQNIPYWMVGGTLLGAVRHQGFIPWDDDVDLGMMRDDIDRLKRLLENDPDYMITVVWDRIAHCKQIRFRPRDTRIPGFIDLFVFDWCRIPDEDTFAVMSEARLRAIERAEEDPQVASVWSKDVYQPAGSPVACRVEEIFGDEFRKQSEAGIGCPEEQAGGIIRSFDNMDHPARFRWVCRKEDMLPLKTLEFEGHKYTVPANYQYLLSQAYGDIYSLPDDIGLHFVHVTREDMADIASDTVLRYVNRAY